MNTLSNISAQTDSNSTISSITINGTTDNICSNLRLDVLDSNTGDVLLTGPVEIVGANWSKTFTSPDDFTAIDFNCNDTLRVLLKCRDTSPSVILLDDTAPINCSVRNCLITVDTLIGTPNLSQSTGLSHLEVGGTASCGSVDISVQNGAVGITRNNVTPDTNGRWNTIFIFGDTESQTKLKAVNCNDSIEVTIRCSADPSCSVNSTEVVVCNSVSPCPDRASIRITGPNGYDKTNPTDDELECMPFGDYTLTCITNATNYIWSSADVTISGADLARNVVSVNGNTMVVRYGSSNLNWHFTVIAVNAIDCLPTASVAFHCGGTPPKSDVNPSPDDNDIDDAADTSNSCGLCCRWFIANIFLVFLTVVAFAVAGCFFQFVEPFSLGLAIMLAVVTTISIFAWANECRARSGNSCTPLLRWLDILDALSVLAGVVALALGGISPCAFAFWINVAFLQWVRRILQTFSMFLGCSPNPWWRTGR